MGLSLVGCQIWLGRVLYRDGDRNGMGSPARIRIRGSLSRRALGEDEHAKAARASLLGDSGCARHCLGGDRNGGCGFCQRGAEVQG